jgi:hypothetical protein
MSDNETFVQCDEHGKQPATCVCQHIVQTLMDGQPRGFWWAADAENSKPDAWCSECEAYVQASGGAWTEENEAFAGVKLLCGACYDKVKESNLRANESD